MFELVVYLCALGDPTQECPQWRPYEDFAVELECNIEATRIETMLVAKGLSAVYSQCEPLPEVTQPGPSYKVSFVIPTLRM